MEKHIEKKTMLARKSFTHEGFNKSYKDDVNSDIKTTVYSRIYSRIKCSKHCLINGLLRYIPFINVLRTYNPRQMLLPDVLAGISVAVLHIPMGIGFGLLASLAPVNGLYISFFPVVVYAFLGTSHHTSVGTNAVVAVLVSGIVDKQSDLMQLKSNDSMPVFKEGSSLNSSLAGFENLYDSFGANDLMDYKVSVAAASSLIVGSILGLMGFLGLGILAVFFSDPLISGFTFGVSLHVALYQMSKMIGLRLKSPAGIFKFVFTLKAFFANISEVNFAALILSLVSLVLLVAVKWANDRFKSKLRFPIPIDFIVAVLATIVSHFLNMSVRYGLLIVNKVPSGLSGPRMPAIDAIPSIAGDSFVVAVLVFATSMAMVKLLAKQWHYSIDESQELVAYGVGNALGAFFQCFPSCQFAPRSMVAASLNVKTTLSGIISALVVLIVLLFLGQFLESLPICALAAMIVVSMSKLYANIFDIKRFWVLNKHDFLIWIITAVVTIFIDMDIGLYVGLGTSLITVIFQLRKSGGRVLGQTDDGKYLVDVKSSSKIHEIPGIKIFQFNAPVFFGNVDVFQNQLYELTVNPDVANHKTYVTVENTDAINKSTQETVSLLNSGEKYTSPETKQLQNCSLAPEMAKTHITLSSKPAVVLNDPLTTAAKTPTPISYIVLDFSRVTYVDATALKVLELIVKSYDLVDIYVVMAECSTPVYSTLRKVPYFQNQPEERFAFDVLSAIAYLSKGHIITGGDTNTNNP